MEIKPEKFPLFFAKMKEAFSVFKGEQTEQKFGKAVLNDPNQTAIEWEGDQIVPGIPVTVMTEAGAAPLPDGEYVTADGVSFKIMGGVVGEVEMPEAEQPEAPAAPAGEMMGDEKKENMEAPAPQTNPMPTHIIERLEREQIFEKIAAFEQNIAGLSETIATLKSENEKLSDELNKERQKFAAFNAQMEKAIEELGEMPQNPKKVEQNFREEKKDDINEWRKKHGLLK